MPTEFAYERFATGSWPVTSILVMSSTCWGARLDGTAIEYIAHWITPEAEARRYDTRFFAAIVPPKSEPSPDPREMTDALWLAPAEALKRHNAGLLPMIFPTIRTLEGLTAFETPSGALAHYRASRIPTIMPTLMRTPEGLQINIIDEEGGGANDQAP